MFSRQEQRAYKKKLIKQTKLQRRYDSIVRNEKKEELTCMNPMGYRDSTAYKAIKRLGF